MHTAYGAFFFSLLLTTRGPVRRKCAKLPLTHRVYGDWFRSVEHGAADRLDELGKGES
jgi:hypothetical protein